MPDATDADKTAPIQGNTVEDGTFPVDIDDQLIEQILVNDLAAIVRKAKEGKPLNARERALVEEYRAARQKATEPEEFHLDGGQADNPMATMTQVELAKEWGYSVRQLKNWIADGRKANDPAPVRNPKEMPAWFRRIYAPRDCPEKLRLASMRLIEGIKSRAAPSPPPVPVRIEIAAEEKGLLAMLDRYRTAEAELHKKYMAAIDAGNETLSQFYLSEWSKMGEKLRALEKSAPKALEELGIYVRRDAIQRELEPLHSAILKGFRQAFRLARPRLKATSTQEEWAHLVDDLVEQVALMLVETEFREPLELQVA